MCVGAGGTGEGHGAERGLPLELPLAWDTNYFGDSEISRDLNGKKEFPIYSTT